MVIRQGFTGSVKRSCFVASFRSNQHPVTRLAPFRATRVRRRNHPLPESGANLHQGEVAPFAALICGRRICARLHSVSMRQVEYCLNGPCPVLRRPNTGFGPEQEAPIATDVSPGCVALSEIDMPHRDSVWAGEVLPACY